MRQPPKTTVIPEQQELTFAHIPKTRRTSEPTDARDLNLKRYFFGQVRLDPDTAQTWADLNVGNRRFRKHYVVDLTRMILNGEWQPDHPQPIVFSSDGILIDGQHRIHAIIKSRKTVVAVVMCGVRPELRQYLDMGISRALEDRVQFDPDLNVNKRVSALVTAFSGACAGNSRKRLTPDEAKEIFDAHRGGIMFAQGLMTTKQRVICRAYVMVAMAELWERDASLAEDFGRSLLYADGEIQQARMLRDSLLRLAAGRMKGAGGQQLSVETYERAVCCAKAALEDRPVSIVRRARW